MFADIKIPLMAIVWFLLIFLVVGSIIWGVFVYQILKDFRRNDKRLQEQMIHIKRFEDDGK